MKTSLKAKPVLSSSGPSLLHPPSLRMSPLAKPTRKLEKRIPVGQISSGLDQRGVGMEDLGSLQINIRFPPICGLSIQTLLSRAGHINLDLNMGVSWLCSHIIHYLFKRNPRAWLHTALGYWGKIAVTKLNEVAQTLFSWQSSSRSSVSNSQTCRLIGHSSTSPEFPIANKLCWGKHNADFRSLLTPTLWLGIEHWATFSVLFKNFEIRSH